MAGKRQFPEDINDADNQKLHREIVTGFVQMVKYTIRMAKVGTILFSDVWRVGTEGKGPVARNYIFELAKHGLIYFSEEQLEQIFQGDYSLVWKEVNDELFTHGYKRVTPCKIEEVK